MLTHSKENKHKRHGWYLKEINGPFNDAKYIPEKDFLKYSDRINKFTPQEIKITEL
jgi:hypothetical protein